MTLLSLEMGVLASVPADCGHTMTCFATDEPPPQNTTALFPFSSEGVNKHRVHLVVRKVLGVRGPLLIPVLCILCHLLLTSAICVTYYRPLHSVTLTFGLCAICVTYS